MCYLYFGAYLRFFVYFLDCILHTYPPPSPTFLVRIYCLLKEGREVFPLTLGCCFHILRTDGCDVGWLDRLRSNMTMENQAFEDVSSVEIYGEFSNVMSCHVSFQRSRCFKS